MIDGKTQMLDAGMVLFRTEKPFGNVLGGIRRELLGHGKVYRRGEVPEKEVPLATGEYDLFLDWSSPLRRRYVACRLEDAGDAGETPEGETIHRYAACFREGNRSTWLRNILTWVPFMLLIVLASLPAMGAIIPRYLSVPIVVAAGLGYVFLMQQPSRKAQKLIASLLDTIEDAK